MGSTSGAGRLPAEVTSFVGRAAELDALAGLVGRARLVTVTGPGGVGKSRLALRAAALLADGFPDGAHLAEVAPVRDPLLLGHAVLEALRLTDHTARPPLDVLVEQLADREALLVLDGCEHLVAACAELVDALLRAAPGLRVVATSRQSLRTAGEHLLPLAPLACEPVGGGADPEAALLFADRAAAVLPGFRLDHRNRNGVALLCRRLDGVPLALELAAGRLRTLSVEQLAARLEDRFRLLTGGDRTAPARHRTLRTAIGWSHELCTMQERLLWARLSVFAGGFDLEAVEYVCAGHGLAADEVLELVDSLVDKSVLDRLDGDGAVRFRMLDTLREYGAGWLRAGGDRPRLLRRHRDWYLGLATWGEVEWFGPRQARTAERTRLAHPNLRAALEFSLAEPGEEQLALVLAGTLWYFWVCTGHLGEGRHWLDRALALAPEPTEARAKALWVTGYLATLQGDLDRARPALEECRRQALDTGDDRALAYAVHRQGCAALIGDEPVRAAELFEEALWHYDALGELNSHVLMAMFELALAHFFQGHEEDGRAWIERLRETCEEHGEQWAYGYCLYAMAFARRQGGDLGPARALARESMRLHHLFRDLLGIVLAMDLLALLATEGPDADLGEARVLQGAAHRIWRAVGTPFFGSRSFNGPHLECERRARDGLTEQECAAAFRLGSRLDLDAAVRRALGGGSPRERETPPRSEDRGGVPLAGQRE
ncbi:regulator [Kitasatospora sp. NA04385]|uniref:ATP-binding protein n=1 Tax=Kitasatospora sp. NA04385 TaxID=2742135 RepID=UPI00159222B2|nr:regulator [Kitasatospora sp. NA04385]QKW18640.1 regulator [Kitasatospora sp. NA04385]